VFKDLGNAILKDLARIILKAALLKALMSSFNPGGSGWTAAIGKFLFPKEGAAFGADFTVGGSGGADSKVVAFRASPGERIMAIPKAMSGASMGENVSVVQNNTFATGVDSAQLKRAMEQQRMQILADVQSAKRRKVG